MTSTDITTAESIANEYTPAQIKLAYDLIKIREMRKNRMRKK